MVKINLFIWITEELISLDVNSSSEFNKYITEVLKIPNYNLLLDQGEKIAKNKIEKLDSLINKKYKSRDILEILLITNENSYQGSSYLKQDEAKRLFLILENVGMNFNNGVNSNLKKILETVIYVNSEMRRLDNQQRIMAFFQIFYKSLQDRIYKQFNSLSDSYLKYKEKKEELHLSFPKNLCEVKDTLSSFISCEDDINIELKCIESSYEEFKKLFFIFEEKHKKFNFTINNFKEKLTTKLKDNVPCYLPDNFKDVQVKICNLYSDIYKIITKKCIDIRETIISIETSWNYYNFTSLDIFNKILKIRSTNSNKIIGMLDDEYTQLKKGVIEKSEEINFFKNKIDESLEVSYLPQIFKKEIKEIQNEIIKRKEFDLIFQKITNFLNNVFLSKEEKRRKEFSERMSSYNKHHIYKNIFNKLYSRFVLENEKISEKLFEGLETVDQNLNYLLNFVYNGNVEEFPVKMSNLYKTKEIPPSASELDWNDQLIRLYNIQNDFKKILKENFKLKEADEFELNRNNSEAVLIDREELLDNCKVSPVINLKFNPENSKNQENIFQEVSDQINQISNLIKKLNEISKAPDHSINLDISNTSLINSIYLSQMISNEKNQIPHQQDAVKYNTYLDIENFVMQYEDKIYFYDAFFDYMSNFIKTKKIRFSLLREKPQMLGLLIEQILRDWLKCKRNLDNYKDKLKGLLVK